MLLVIYGNYLIIFFFSSRRRHTRFKCDWSSDVCSSDLLDHYETPPGEAERVGFEPTRACTLPLFESGTFDHSDISPPRSIAYLPGYDKPPSSFASSNNRGLDAAAQLHCAAASSPRLLLEPLPSYFRNFSLFI